MSDVFYELYRDLMREGPGEAADVRWALAQISLPDAPLIGDLACGSGADMAVLAAGGPDYRVIGIERQPHFVAQARRRYGGDPQIEVREGDMFSPGGPYDLIWCAGAVYFLGITPALQTWRSALKPGGVVVFSDICWWRAQPSGPARDFWREYPAMTDTKGIAEQVNSAGYETKATRRLAESAWSGYYQGLQQRIDQLHDGAGPDLLEVLDTCQTEIDIWTQYRSEYGYLLSIVTPL